MSAFKIFITGATGYIGGDFLYLANEVHPEWQVSCLVRDRSKASDLTSRYPNVRIVHGSLDSIELIEEEAANANLTYHFANCDHKASALAICRGVSRSQSTPVYWIHTSGMGILTHRNFALNNYESALPDEKIYNDWDGIGELTSLPDKALHRHVDKIVLAASSGQSDRVRTAIVCPPAIYGRGRGTGNTQSVQVNLAARLAVQHGRGLRMGDGNNTWHGLHIQDLSQLFLMLGEAAVSGDAKVSWNERGYYLAEAGAFKWGDVIQAIADEGKRLGLMTTSDVESVNFARGQELHKFFPYLCGTTSRGVARRARILLGWKPTQNDLWQELPQIIRDEARSLKKSSTNKSVL